MYPFKKDLNKADSDKAKAGSSRSRLTSSLNRIVGSFKGKGKYRDGEGSGAGPSAEIGREDTILEEDLTHVFANDMSMTSIISAPPSQAPSSQCYSDPDITEIIKTVDLAELIEAVEAQGDPPPVTQIDSSESSLGKRKASDVSELSEPPASIRARIDENPRENPFYIAHNRSLLGFFTSMGLSTGVMWEIARLASHEGKPLDISVEALESLKGSNAQSAPKTLKKLLGKIDAQDDFQAAFAKELSAKSPWEELDNEEEALRADELAGLGLCDERPGYYGGKVIFSGVLKNVGKKSAPDYRVLLYAAELGPSCRFLRRFGSWNFLKIKIPKPILNNPSNGLHDLFKRPFVINGKVYRAYYAKDSNVFFFRTNEVIGPQDTIMTSTGRGCGPMSLLNFLNWHNPLELNSRQAMAKWATRFSLGLSTSVPGLRIKPENMLSEKDIISAAPHNSDMTDGCGYVNHAALMALRMRFEWNTFPTAIQCRLGGSKGLLCLHPGKDKNLSEDFITCTRPSQVKIQYPDMSLDPAMCIIDVLQSSHMRVPARLSAETIVNLAENKVPYPVFEKLFREGLKAQVAPLTQWDGRDAMFDLWCYLARIGGVIPARRAREASAEAKAKGYRIREPEEPDDEDDFADSNLTHERSTAWWGDEISGCPSSLEETCMALLDSGFTPTNCAVLRDKLFHIVRKTIDTYVSRFRIDVPMSCSALLIPDPFDELDDNEVHIKSSHREFQTADGMETDIIVGDVLITRNPCKLPTDIRKVKAVYKQKLAGYTDVIVCSIKGFRRLAEWLAGGDYDGDKGIVFYDPALVQAFTNADEKYSYEPESVAKCFKQHTETVGDVLRRTEGKPPVDQMREYQTFLLGAIQDTSIVGIYSSFHDVAAYTLGYDHEDTVRLVYMFCALLDRFKNGRILLPKALADDQQQFQARPPAWKESKEEAEKFQQSVDNRSNPTRPPTLTKFIMDEIMAQANRESDTLKGEMEDVFKDTGGVKPDPDLIVPWKDVNERIEKGKAAGKDMALLEAALDTIQCHVKMAYGHYKEQKQQAVNDNAKAARTKMYNSSKTEFTNIPIAIRQDALRAASKEFAAKPSSDEIFILSQEEIARLRASYAYLHDSEQGRRGWSRFPWDVAMRELCAIKARAVGQGQTKTVSQDFYSRFTMKPSSSRRP